MIKLDSNENIKTIDLTSSEDEKICLAENFGVKCSRYKSFFKLCIKLINNDLV